MLRPVGLIVQARTERVALLVEGDDLQQQATACLTRRQQRVDAALTLSVSGEQEIDLFLRQRQGFLTQAPRLCIQRLPQAEIGLQLCRLFALRIAPLIARREQTRLLGAQARRLPLTLKEG